MPDAATTRGPPAELVVIGASAGGVEALKELVAMLPVTLACPVLVVLHLSARGRSMLPAILDRAGPLEARVAVHGAWPGAGVHVAPVDRHLLISSDGLLLDTGPKEHGLRPAIDPTMRSAAATFGPGAVGVVLSGTGHDGAEGLSAIREAGGRSLVQDPAQALYAAMPEHAIAAGAPDAVLPLTELSAQLAAWARR
ncbi:MAG: chemotaxis protein CheB [Solirubrobacterales bacterium]|nr:chemotaxis protein CheB [Solirubrobacterales bacterium]